jgi:uncharacterized protein (DUF924 family)
MTPKEIVAFWNQVGEKRWFAVCPTLDAETRRRFETVWQDARDGRLADWEQTAEGSLALVILLDQFPRNMFRGTAKAFSTDALAREVAQRAVANGYDTNLPEALRVFFYLPFMHSEDVADQDRCVALIEERLGRDSRNYPFALGHREIVRQFGRFPARNKALERTSSLAEEQFLDAAARPVTAA